MKKSLKKNLLTAAFVALLSTALASSSTHFLTFLKSLENMALDIRMAAFQPFTPQSSDIVIAAITEETVTQFPYRSPVDREFLANLIQTLDRKGAKVIGVDVLIDQATEPAKDQLLYDVLRKVKAPLFFSYTVTPSVVNDDQLAYMNRFIPPEKRAGANLATDPFDGAVRWIFPGETVEGMPIGFGRKAALLAGVDRPKEWPEIAWRAQPDLDTPAFPIYPSHAIQVLPDEWFKGKIVLVGAVLSITDRHRTPLSVVFDDDRGMMPGIVIQAHGVSQLLEGRKSPRLPVPQAVLFTALLAIVGTLIGLSSRGILFNVVLGSLVIVGLWLGAILGYSHGLPMLPLVGPTLALALALWMMDLAIGRAERKQREFVQGAFSRYVSPAVVGQLVENPESLAITGIRKEATFVFTDIAGFTTLSEALTSEKLSEVLNEYLDGACQIILKYEGTVDKFIGDAIMSIFNAPIAQIDHADRAVKCALDLDAYAEAFRQRKNTEGIPLGVTRIGVHSGMSVIGNFGSSSRMDFTALGDTVNTAARTEGVNKYFGTRICCTQEVVNLTQCVKYLPIGDVVLKGKTQAVRLFNPVSDDKAASSFFTDYLAAFELLHAQDQSAGHAFDALKVHYPDEPLVDFHRERLQRGLCTARVVMEDK